MAQRPPRPTTTLRVLRREQLTPHMVRLYLGGDGIAHYTAVDFTDGYVKLIFGTADEPVLRTYTIAKHDPVAREIAIDFVVHGDQGVAGPWAANVPIGDDISFYGPAGAYAPDSVADWHLLAGDETAIPALAAAVSALPTEARGYLIVEVADRAEQQDLAAPAGIEVRWLIRGTAAGDATDAASGVNAPLVAAVKSAPWLDGDVQVFVHGEAQAVMHGIRPYLLRERNVPRERASISGYWRRGRSEEGFREWKRDLAAAEGR